MKVPLSASSRAVMAGCRLRRASDTNCAGDGYAVGVLSPHKQLRHAWLQLLLRRAPASNTIARSGIMRVHATVAHRDRLCLQADEDGASQEQVI